MVNIDEAMRGSDISSQRYTPARLRQKIIADYLRDHPSVLSEMPITKILQRRQEVKFTSEQYLALAATGKSMGVDCEPIAAKDCYTMMKFGGAGYSLHVTLENGAELIFDIKEIRGRHAKA